MFLPYPGSAYTPKPAVAQPAPQARYDTSQKAGELASQNAGRTANAGTGSAYVDPNETVYYTDAHGTHKVVRDSRSGVRISDVIITPPSSGGPPGGGYPGGGGGGITAYEKAQIELDKQKLADAEAQQKADEAYRQAQEIEAFNKQWQDYQVKNYYGSFGGPSSAAPAGSPWFYRLPESPTVQNYYKNNPNAGPDPWNTPIGVSGYSGSGFLNAQQPGIQGLHPIGATPASASGQQAANPFPGQSTGMGSTPVSAQPTGHTLGSAQPMMTGSASQPYDPNTHQALIQAISSHPDANAYALSLPGVREAVQAQMGAPQMGIPGPTPMSGGGK